MKIKILSIVLISLVALLCCKKEEVNDNIIGKWEWVMTSFGDYNFPGTPESVDSTYYIEFNTDGFYYLCDNYDQQIRKIRYFPGNKEQLTTISFENYDSSAFIYRYSILNDTLSIVILNQIYPVIDIYKRVH